MTPPDVSAGAAARAVVGSIGGTVSGVATTARVLGRAGVIRPHSPRTLGELALVVRRWGLGPAGGFAPPDVRVCRVSRRLLAGRLLPAAAQDLLRDRGRSRCADARHGFVPELAAVVC